MPEETKKTNNNTGNAQTNDSTVASTPTNMNLGAISNPLTPAEIGELKLAHFDQGIGLCGPAALRILLSYFDKNYSEEELAKICDASAEQGTEHEGLIQGIKELGGYVFSKEGGAIEDLKYFIKEEKLPIIVGWFDPAGIPDDHYSVIVNVTDKHIIMVDPFVNGRRQIDIKVFEKLWFDFIGKDNRVVSWNWYLVASFEKKKFKIKGTYY